MKLKLYVMTGCLMLTTILSGCAQLGSPADEQEQVMEQTEVTAAPVVTTVTAQPVQISTGYIDAGSAQYVTLYRQPDSSSAAIARLYTGDEISIYGLEGEWSSVSSEGLLGYVQNQNIVFQKPEAKTEAVTAEATAPPANNNAEQKAQQTQAPVTIVLKYDANGIAEPSSYPHYQCYSDIRNGYCSANSCYMYKTASTSGPKREAEMLYKNDPVTVYGEYDGFYYLGTDGGSGYDWVGYVPKKYITLGNPPASDRKNYNATEGVVDAGSCHIRSTPSKEDDNNIIATVYTGFSFKVISFDGYWYYISYDNGNSYGYISHKMVKVW